MTGRVYCDLELGSYRVNLVKTGQCKASLLPVKPGDWGRKRKGQVVVLVASHLKERRSMEVHGFSKEINGRWTVNVAARNSHLFGVMVRLVQRKD